MHANKNNILFYKDCTLKEFISIYNFRFKDLRSKVLKRSQIIQTKEFLSEIFPIQTNHHHQNISLKITIKTRRSKEQEQNI